MTINALLYSSLHPLSTGGAALFRRSFTDFVSKDEIPQTGARQLAHILKQEGKFVVQIGAESTLDLTLPCDDLLKHLGTDIDENMTLDMVGTLEIVDQRIVSILEEDGWISLNPQLLFDLYGIEPAIH